MKNTLKTLALPLLAIGLLGACSSIQLEPKAKDVKVLEQARTKNCDRVGQTRVSVKTTIGFIARDKANINQDLERLARNSAADMGGDTVTATGPEQDGKQNYIVYDCVQ